MRNTLFVALALLAPLSAQKLDRGIEEGQERMPVFVRFEEQLFRKAADFTEFCAQNADRDRRELRRELIEKLRKASDAAWKRLGKEGELRDSLRQVRRYWVVNGFACLASYEQCKSLAALADVAFVYRQPVPRLPALHASPPRPIRNEERVAAQEKQWVELALRSLKEAAKAGQETPATGEDAKLPWSFPLTRLHAPEAWKTGARGQGIVVALLDTGLLPTPALTRALWRNEAETLNGKDDDGNGYVDDLFGYDFARGRGVSIGDFRRCHGSMCGGIVAGRPVTVPGKMRVCGVAPEARLMVVRGMGDIRAYEYALANGADVVSMSYMWVNVELGNWRGIYRLAHEHMTAAGVVSVGGSGNFARQAPAGRQIALPKDIPCVISVSGLDAKDELPVFSSEGPVSWAGVRFYDDFGPGEELIKPDVTAYSMEFAVWSRLGAWPTGRRGMQHVYDAGDGAGLVIGPRGNSFAGPHGAGVAALMLSANPALPAWRVKELMEATCKDLGPEGRDPKFGAGLLDAEKAVAAARAATKRTAPQK